MQPFVDTVIHRWLRIPYVLHVRHKRLRKGAATTYIFIHGLGDTGALWEPLIAKLPDDVNYVAVDLLGFGKSKKPAWATYDAAMQARSLLATYLRLGMHGSVTVIGHSLGSLVAVEFAKRYPLQVTELLLCSPPVYDTNTGRKTKMLQQDILTRLYADAAKNPAIVLSAYALGKKLRLVHQTLEVNPETLPAFMSSLNASIVNQGTLRLIRKLRMPITIIDGMFDVLTVNPILRDMVKGRENMRLVTLPVTHVINGLYMNKILELIGVKKEKTPFRGAKGVRSR